MHMYMLGDKGEASQGACGGRSATALPRAHKQTK